MEMTMQFGDEASSLAEQVVYPTVAYWMHEACII